MYNPLLYFQLCFLTSSPLVLFSLPPPSVLHGGSPEEQGPPGEGVGGAVRLSGRAQRLHRRHEGRQRQEEPLHCRRGM